MTIQDSSRYSFKFLSILSLAVMMFLLSSGTAFGLIIRGGNESYVSEKIDDDLILGGNDVKFDGEIRGDIIAAGQDVVIDGLVDGNINAAGYSVKAGGTVYRSVRLAGYKVTADGQILGNLMLAGAIARVSPTCEVKRDVNISSAIAYVNGIILGSLNIEAEEVIISGTIDGDVKISADKSVKIERSAQINGSLHYSCPERAKIANGAQIEGETKWKKEAKSGDESGALWALMKTGILFIGAYIIGLILLWLCKPSCCSVRDIIAEQLGRSLGYGLVLFVVVPIALLLIMVTIVGIPLSLLSLLLYIILFYVAKLFVAIALGDKILSMLNQSGTRSQALSLLIGLIILTIMYKIPFIGWAVYLLSVMIGLGAILIAFGRRRRAQAEVTSS